MQSLSLTTPLPPSRSARVCDGQWRRRKHGLSWRVPSIVRNGIRIARVHASSMASNTCCTALLVQGTTDTPT